MPVVRERWVNAYAVTRHYGGPEEGGWWWDRYTSLASVPVCKGQRAEAIRARLERHFAGEKHGNIYSVLGGVDVVVRIEDAPKASETTERPRYE